MVSGAFRTKRSRVTLVCNVEHILALLQNVFRLPTAAAAGVNKPTPE